MVWLTVAATALSAQTHIVDSLKSRLYTTSDSKERLQLLLALGHEQYSLNRDTAYQYAIEARALAVEGTDRDKSLAGLYFAQSYIPWGWIDSALAALQPVLTMNPVNDPGTRDLHFLLYRQQAMSYGYHAKYKEALEILYRLIKDATFYKDSVALGANLNSIGSIAYARKQPQEALSWYYRALAYATHDNRFLPVITAIYINLADASVALGRNDSAIYYLQKAIPQARKIENLLLLTNALRVQTNSFVKSGQLDKAERSFREMQAVIAKTDVSNNADNNMAIIEFYTSTGQMDKAIALANKFSANSRSVEIRLPFYEALAAIYKQQGNDSLYRQTLEKIIPLKDTVYAENTAKEIADIQTKYETQIKENAIIEEQRLNLVRKNYLFYGLLALLVLAAILGFFIFKEYRRRQRITMTNIVSEEKRMAQEAIREAEEKERVRIAGDLHDNLGAYAASLASNLNYLRVDEKDELVKGAFRELKNNSGAMIAELHDTIWALKKDTLSLTAISDRIKVFVSRLRNSYPGINLEVKEKVATDHTLSSSHAFHLYRILQEAVNNALKHSQGNSIQVLFNAGESWTVSVTDNGRGMPAGRETPKDSNGLLNMKERSRENGWKINWHDNEGGGTTVEVMPTSNG